MEYTGIGASKGIAIGKVFRYRPFVPHIAEEILSAGQEEAAVKEYERAISMAEKELRVLADRLAGQGAEEAKIFTAHLDILSDEAMDQDIRDSILCAKMSSPWAVHSVYTQYADVLAQTGDPIIRERAADLLDVERRLQRCLAGEAERDLSSLGEPVIVVATDLLPSDTATIDRKNVLAIVTEVGGATCHSAILARSYEIPAVLGAAGVYGALRDGQVIVADACKGVVLTDQSPQALETYEAARKRFQVQQGDEKRYLSVRQATRDGVSVEVHLNIGSAAPQELSHSAFVDGVGLFRSEFLYMNRKTQPGEEEQYEAYRKVLEAFDGRPVTLRTLDIGGDKVVECLDLPKEANPFLGNRALRLCFQQEELFLTQLRAALRASVHGDLRLMFPMVGSMDDVRRAKSLVEKARAQLREAGCAVREDIPIGVMVEIPSLAMLGESLAREVDFASIGSNDLTQYLLAADRVEPSVAPYYQMFHPAVFRVIRMLCQSFRQAQKPLCICGELGGDPRAAAALIGFGMRKLSMGAASVAPIKKLICKLDMATAQKAAELSCSYDTAAEVEQALSQLTQEIMDD